MYEEPTEQPEEREGNFILDENDRPIPCPNSKERTAWFENNEARWHIAETKLTDSKGNTFVVSTIFTGCADQWSCGFLMNMKYDGSKFIYDEPAYETDVYFNDKRLCEPTYLRTVEDAKDFHEFRVRSIKRYLSVD